MARTMEDTTTKLPTLPTMSAGVQSANEKRSSAPDVSVLEDSWALAQLANCVQRSRERTEPMLREMVSTLDSRSALISAYHFGWRDEAGAPTSVNASKMIRPTLSLLGAEAAGVSTNAAVAGAAAVELLHNFSLIHDDIIDGDESRRQRPTVWKVFGVPAAILVGDALQGLALETLMTRGGPHGGAAALRMARAMRAVIRGQTEDTRFSERPWTGPDAVTVPEYLSMAEGKTGVVLAFAITVGAELGGAAPHVLDALDRAARHLGIGFQAVDDVIGIWGDPDVTGKPVFGDLREKKKSLPIVAAVQSAHPAVPELLSLLSRTQLSHDELKQAAQWIEEAGGRKAAEAEGQAQLEAAWRCLETVPMSEATRKTFEVLSLSFIHRVR